MNVSVEFESALEAAARDIDAAAWVRDDPNMQGLRTRLEARGLEPVESQALCERLVRSLVGFVGRDIGEAFDRVIGRLMDTQGRIMQLYRAALEANRLSDDFAPRLGELLRQREELFNELRDAAARDQTDVMQSEKVTIAALTGAEDAGNPVVDLPGEDPGLEEIGRTDHPTRPSPRRPLPGRALTAGQQQLAAMVAQVRATLQIPNGIDLDWGTLRGGSSDASTAQFRGLRLLDADFAGRGTEAIFTLADGDRFQIDGLIRDPNSLPGHFRLGDYKADLAPPEWQSYYEGLEPFSDGEGQFRNQLSRLLYLHERLPTCDGISFLTNSERNAAALRALVARVAHPNELPYIEVRWAP